MTYTVDGCPWKVTTNAIPTTQMVKVFSFRNMHNHSVDDLTFGKPIFCTKHGGALVDDLIKWTLDCLPKQICKDFELHNGMHLSYVQAWSMHKKAKERIHGMPQSSYTLLSWLC